MGDLSSKLHDEIEGLQRLRDELRVQANLGAKEARDLWAEAEQKWEQIEHSAGQLRQASAESGREIAVALGLLADSLREAYRSLKSKL